MRTTVNVYTYCGLSRSKSTWLMIIIIVCNFARDQGRAIIFPIHSSDFVTRNRTRWAFKFYWGWMLFRKYQQTTEYRKLFTKRKHFIRTQTGAALHCVPLFLRSLGRSQTLFLIMCKKRDFRHFSASQLIALIEWSMTPSTSENQLVLSWVTEKGVQCSM